MWSITFFTLLMVVGARPTWTASLCCWTMEQYISLLCQQGERQSLSPCVATNMWISPAINPSNYCKQNVDSTCTYLNND